MQNLIQLVTNENSVIIKHLGIYVCKAFELRVNHDNRYKTCVFVDSIRHIKCLYLLVN